MTTSLVPTRTKIIAKIRAVLGAYAAFVALTWRSKRSLAPWGPLWLVKIVLGFWQRVLRICSVDHSMIFPPELVKALENKQLQPCVVSFSPHGAMAMGHLLCGIGRQRITPELHHGTSKAKPWKVIRSLLGF